MKNKEYRILINGVVVSKENSLKKHKEKLSLFENQGKNCTTEIIKGL